VSAKIVIAGFGDTGVLTAAHLGRGHNITAISTKPLLVSGQELGARLSRLSEWKTNYLMEFDRIKQLDGVSILQGKVSAIKPAQNQITYLDMDGTQQDIDYDILVIASGTRNGFWRTDSVQDASAIERELEALSAKLTTADKIAIIGGGPTAVSTASNLKETHPDKDIHLFYPRALPLRGYADKTRKFVEKRLLEQGLNLHAERRAKLPKSPFPVLEAGTIKFETGQIDFEADCILWAVGDIQPNSDFIPPDMLDESGFVRVEPTFQSKVHENIFAIGDIAATDLNRSSARNMGYQLIAKNIGHFLASKPQKMKPFKPPLYRWGSVLGIQNEGLRIFTPKGTPVRIGPWTVKNLLYPLAVDRMIYRGIRRD